MSDYVSSLPIVDKLIMLIKTLMLLNALLTGGVIYFAWQTLVLGRRVRELEGEQSRLVPEPEPSPPSSPLADDRPIPIVRHRFGDASAILKRRSGDVPDRIITPDS